MMKRHIAPTAPGRENKKILVCLFAAALSALLAGCGTPGNKTSNAPQGATDEQSAAPYRAPAYASAEFHREMTEGTDQVRVDLSATSEGYVAVAAISESNLKMQVIKQDVTYTYDLSSDGQPDIFPLQSGDGLYRFFVLEQVSGNRYAEIYETSCQVTLENEFAPYLRPSDYVSYTPESRCVSEAARLAETAGDTLGMIQAVCEYVTQNISYDTDKAATVTKGYLPDVDEVLQSGKGICFDYAALTAAMLRSQGIPTKMIFGYVSPDGLYHAWNMVYSEQSGWVIVRFELHKNEWNRLDLTAAAAGADTSFVGDGTNYTDVYQY